jgi:hypothetical protein
VFETLGRNNPSVADRRLSVVDGGSNSELWG